MGSAVGLWAADLSLWEYVEETVKPPRTNLSVAGCDAVEASTQFLTLYRIWYRLAEDCWFDKALQTRVRITREAWQSN